MQDQKVVRELYADKGRSVEHGFTSRPEWHGPLPERPTYCDCCVQTSDGKATGRAMLPSVLNNRVYSRDDSASVKALADARAQGMMEPPAEPAAPLPASNFPKIGTPAAIGKMFQGAQTMFRNARSSMPSMPSMPAAADVTEPADVEGEEPIESVSTENAPADEGSVPAASSAFRIRRRRRRKASRATLNSGEIAGISIGSLVGGVLAVIGIVYILKHFKNKGVGSSLPEGRIPTAPVATGAGDTSASVTVSAMTNLFS